MHIILSVPTEFVLLSSTLLLRKNYYDSILKLP